MYTGIVQSCLPITRLRKEEGLYSFSIPFTEELIHELETGASVSVNGVCFTVTGFDGDQVSFDAVRETLDLTNIKYLEVGTLVNIERSAKHDAEIGGHIMSGHVVGTAQVNAVDVSPNNHRLSFSCDPDWLKYVFNKGFLGINGASLTIAKLNRETSEIAVNLIPETLARTNFGLLKVGDEVNIEIESQTQIIVDTVERIMAERYAVDQHNE